MNAPGPYRAFTAPRAVTCVQHALSPLGVSLVVFMLVVIELGCSVTAFTAASTVAFDCARATGRCTLTTTDPLGGRSAEDVPLASIASTSIVSIHGKNGTRYAIALDMRGGEPRKLSSRYGDLDVRKAQKQPIDAFLADPRQPALHVDYDASDPSVFGFILQGVVLVLLVYVLGVHARLRFDAPAGTLHVAQKLWFFTTSARTFPLGDLRAFEVDTSLGPKGGTVYQAVMVLADGRRLAPLTGITGSRKYAEKAAVRMRRAFSAATGLGGV